MKFIKSKLIQKAEGRKIGKYEITLSVTDNDLLMLEDLATTYAPFQLWKNFKDKKITYEEFNIKSIECDFSKKYYNWLLKTWRCFCKLWRKYD